MAAVNCPRHCLPCSLFLSPFAHSHVQNSLQTTQHNVPSSTQPSVARPIPVCPILARVPQPSFVGVDANTARRRRRTVSGPPPVGGDGIDAVAAVGVLRAGRVVQSGEWSEPWGNRFDLMGGKATECPRWERRDVGKGNQEEAAPAAYSCVHALSSVLSDGSATKEKSLKSS